MAITLENYIQRRLKDAGMVSRVDTPGYALYTHAYRRMVLRVPTPTTVTQYEYCFRLCTRHLVSVLREATHAPFRTWLYVYEVEHRNNELILAICLKYLEAL